MDSFPMDKTAFRINTFAEADNNTAYWLKQPPVERLRAAAFLIRQAFNLPPDDPMRLDRRLFRIKRRSMSNNIFNPDFQDFIKAFNQHNVKYILVGGYAVILHGYSRTTGDMDIWVEASSENYQNVAKAFHQFGMPVFDMVESKFLATKDYDVFTFGLPPSAIDLITDLKGLDFPEAYERSTLHEFDDLIIRVVDYNDLIAAKKAAGRPRDINDIEKLKDGHE